MMSNINDELCMTIKEMAAWALTLSPEKFDLFKERLSVHTLPILTPYPEFKTAFMGLIDSLEKAVKCSGGGTL